MLRYEVKGKPSFISINILRSHKLILPNVIVLLSRKKVLHVRNRWRSLAGFISRINLSCEISPNFHDVFTWALNSSGLKLKKKTRTKDSVY